MREERMMLIGDKYPWWAGTGYEVPDPILDECRETSLQATYTPGNGIRLHLTDLTERNGFENWLEFDLSREQAVWLGNKLLTWAAHNHGFSAEKE